MKIIIDAMGGDQGPKEVVKGTIDAINEYGIKAIIVGKEDIIKSDEFYHIDRSLMKEIKWTIKEYIDKIYIQKLKIAYSELLIKRKACLQDLKNINLQIEKDYNNAILEFQN